MEVRMKVQISGSRDGADWPAPGETIDVPDDEAATLIAQGNAVDAADKVETATAEPVETAVADAAETTTVEASEKAAGRGNRDKA